MIVGETMRMTLEVVHLVKFQKVNITQLGTLKYGGTLGHVS